MCPSEAGSRSTRCTLLNADPVTDEHFPCRFVMVFLAGRRCVKVRKSPMRDRYKAYYRQGAGPWQPVRSSHLPWRATFDEAQTALNFYAAAQGWVPIWPMTAACEGEPVAGDESKGGSRA
jgi:hypothetical protein